VIFAQLGSRAFLNVFRSQRRVVADEFAALILRLCVVRDNAACCPPNRIIGLTMPASKPPATAEHPTEGFHSLVLPLAPQRPIRLYLPTDYQPKYAYPVVVLLHADGSSEADAVRWIPRLSRRNYLALCVRGPVPLGRGFDGCPLFGWPRKADALIAAALRSVATRYSVRPQGVYLVGVGEGGAAAYRFARAYPNFVAGVVACNSQLPAVRGRISSLQFLIAHGDTNTRWPLAEARRAARRLAAAGAEVHFQRYPTSHRLHPDMLRDANRWIMSHVTGKRETE
jgi:phospholipase/carboxylesterase